MGSNEIATAVAGARAYLADHPDEARYRDSAATAVVEDGLRVRVDGPGRRLGHDRHGLGGRRRRSARRRRGCSGPVTPPAWRP